MLVLVVLGAHALAGWGLLQARPHTAAPAPDESVLIGVIVPATTAQIPPTPAQAHRVEKAAPAPTPRPTPDAVTPPQPPMAATAAGPLASSGTAQFSASGPTPSPVTAQAAGESPVFEPAAVASRPASPTPRPGPRGVALAEVRYVVQPLPMYPATSRRLGEVGEVHLRVEIDTDGRARQVSVHRSSGFSRLDESAIAAVRAARFAPFTENGVALAVWTIVPVEFQLHSQAPASLFPCHRVST